MADTSGKAVSLETDSSSSELGAWVRRTRTALGLNQRELAERSGLSRSYICDIELGRSARPTLATLDKVAAALGTARVEIMRAAGYLSGPRGVHPDSGELRLIRLYRDLSPANRTTVERFIEFVHAEEYRWTQASFIDTDGKMPEPRCQSLEPERGPTLFDTLSEPVEALDSRGYAGPR